MVIRELLAFTSGLLRKARFIAKRCICAERRFIAQGAVYIKDKGRRESDLLVDIVQ